MSEQNRLYTMSEQNWICAMNEQNRIREIQNTNQYTGQFGLTLSDRDVETLLAEGKQTLRQQQRVEFGPGILPRIIYAFCDSSFLSQDNYVDTLIRLQEIIFLYKNEMQDEISDDELICFMKEQFENVCCGDPDYLESTCLDLFAQAIRAGYRGYRQTQGHGEFEQFDIVQRWDRELYLETLRELCWR